MGKLAFTKGFASLQAGEDESDGAEHEPGTGTSRHVEYLFAIDGEIVAEYAKTETEEHHVNAYQPTALQEETVEGN